MDIEIMERKLRELLEWKDRVGPLLDDMLPQYEKHLAEKAERDEIAASSADEERDRRNADELKRVAAEQIAAGTAGPPGEYPKLAPAAATANPGLSVGTPATT